ncbi:MAG TPA: hypothetical protein PKY82_08295 [Pyrinomonadaceae bacterium]|nr:hypothetical protein [Pyrinomonadaceae bacterium]
MDSEKVEIKSPKPKIWLTILVGILLFAGTATIVAWQNSRLTVLYDLCGVLENAYRISLGDVPYRDFPFPYAPLTFLIQAGIIKITGAIYWHHILYSAIIGGFGTVLSWRIIFNILRDKIPKANLISFLLSIPLVILGIYCIFPHPFYDPDSVFIILLWILSVQILERKNFPAIRTFLVGMFLVVPLFSKQNIGLAFIGTVKLSLLILIAINLWRKESVKGYLILLVGLTAGFGIAILIIYLTAGLENYWFWTMTFAQMRRTPSFVDMLSVYADWSLLIWISLFVIGAIILWKSSKNWLNYIAMILISMPFLWTIIYLFLDNDNSERAERLVGIYPFIFIVSFVIAIISLKNLSGITSFLPFILIGTMHGIFLSQQLWGSTYATWCLLLILIATMLPFLYGISQTESTHWLTFLSALISITLLISGAFYIYSNERLDYVSFDDGEMQHSKLLQLSGLSMRGTYISDFEELVDWTNQNIPADDGILILPGEDLFNYTTGRKPKMSVLLFDVTNNPLNAEQILQEVKDRDIRWLIVKNDTEIEVDKTIDDKEHIIEVLKPEFKHLESLNNYEIYRRRTPADTNDDDEDDENSDSDDNEDSDN